MMCSPAFAIIGGVVGAMGSMYSAGVQSNQYKAEEKMYKYEQQSQREQGSLDSWRKQRENERLTGDQIAAMASSGAGSLTGTNTDIIRESRAEGDTDVALIRANAQQRADMAGYKAAVAKMNAKAAKTAGLFQAGAGLINSFASAATSFG